MAKRRAHYFAHLALGVYYFSSHGSAFAPIALSGLLRVPVFLAGPFAGIFLWRGMVGRFVIGANLAGWI